MISTKNIISSLGDIPKEWVFEYYLSLTEILTGQDVKILSVFNAKDKVPSMCIYTDTNNVYKFKDFSSSNQGDGIQLVMYMYDLPNREHALNKIINDYQNYKNNNTSISRDVYQIHDKYKVTDHEIRHWTSLDQQYWSGYKLGSKILEYHNVHPLSYFVMEKKELDNSLSSIKFNKPYIYGYFREDGSLYKIYMPKTIDKKFIKIENYIQGIDQLQYESKYLLIVSSLKDLMCFKMLNITNIEIIAPDSENTMISEVILNKLKKRYKSIIVLFDNDDPGTNAAKKYNEKFKFPYVQLDLEKDLSDSVKKYGIEKVREMLLPLLKQAL